MKATEQPFMGTAEVAELFGVRPQAVSNWMKRGRKIPKPLVQLKMGPIWRTEDIVDAWIDHQSSRETELNEKVVKLQARIEVLRQQIRRSKHNALD